jgi:hypothetical protein
MSLNFYTDAQLKNRIDASYPKRFLFPNKGGVKTSQLWVGDPYTSTCSVQAAPGDNVISLTDTGEFYDASDISNMSGGVATAVSGSNTFTYTGKTQSQLTGVSNIIADILVGDTVVPGVAYLGVNSANIKIFPTGVDITNAGIRVSVGSSSAVNFAGLPAIFNQTAINMGVDSAIEVFMSVKMPAGVDTEFTNFALELNNVYKRDISDTTAFSTSEGTYSPEANIYAYRHDQSLPIPIRVLPLNRQVLQDTPGFIVGSYRWRGQTDRNATALVPTNWNVNPNTVGLEKFIAGIGDQDDLELVDLIDSGDSIHAVINRGAYFTGTEGYYLPADWNLEFLATNAANANANNQIVLTLQNTPRPLAPIFIGTYILNQQGFYEKSIEYKYMATLTDPNGLPRTDLPDHFFTLDRKLKRVVLNQPMGAPTVFLGLVSGQSIDYFDLPVYPVGNIDSVFIDRGSSATPLFATQWTFDKEQGTIQVPIIDGALAGQPVFATCQPAVAVLYDSGPDETREIQTVDFNPAFSGLNKGYFYLQHKRQKPASLVLSCDKPRIAIPASQASIVGLVAFGPVFFENDYALLVVTAFSAVSGETVPNARLDVVVDPTTFSGMINYQDPLAQTVSVVTGGDGTANLIFIPKDGAGVYIPTTTTLGVIGGVATTNIANDSLVLPTPIPLGQVWNAQEGWLVTTYTVANNDPLFGMVGGDPDLGQIVFQTTGIPGSATYKTNGERDAWRAGGLSVGALIVPIDALDASGHSYTSAAFDGTVKRLVYAMSVPSGITIGAYFVTFVQRVLIKMRLENSDLFSNTILLQMSTPDLIVENPWLILNDSIQGVLETYRLGYVRSS